MKKESLIFWKRKNREWQNKESLQWLLYSHWIQLAHRAHLCNLFFKLSSASPSSTQEGFLTFFTKWLPKCFYFRLLDSFLHKKSSLPGYIFSAVWSSPQHIYSPHLCWTWEHIRTVSGMVLLWLAEGKNSVSSGI